MIWWISHKMGILDTIASYLGYTKTSVENAPGWLRATGEYYETWQPDRTKPEAQSDLYRRLSWVNVAVTTVAETAATAVLNVKQADGEELADIPNHPFEQLLRRPNPLQSRFELLFETFAFHALTGNAYWWLNRANENATPSEIWIIPPHQIRPVPDGNMFIRGYMYDPGDGVEMPLENHEICHFKRFNPLNRFVGLSPIEALATVAEGDLQMQRWNTNFFGKDNAKVPGALAFSDPIDNERWEQIKSDIQREHGGTKRNMMMLRNVGAGGVQWLAMAMPQKDMEFLAGREFNRDEVFAIYAPGLASMLAINSTEANSVTGKATFNEVAVWPKMVGVAEKITNNILPAYGDNLVSEFEDIRVKDRQMELAEQDAYARTHTIDEIRERFYGEDGIGDERGLLLPAQVSGSTGTMQDEPDDEPPDGDNPFDDSEPVDEDEERTNEEAPTDTKALMAQIASMLSEQPTKAADPEPDDDGSFDDDMAKWRRKALRRLKSGKSAACEFESDHIGDDVAQVVMERLRAADSDQEVKAAFAVPFRSAKATEGYESQLDDYEFQIEQLIAQARADAISEDEFAEQLEELAAAVILAAFLAGGRLTRGELDASEEALLQEQYDIASESAEKFAADLYAGRYDTEAMQHDGIGTEQPKPGLPARVAMWVATAGAMYVQGQTRRRDDPLLEWRYGETEHCDDCLRLHGTRMRASEWRRQPLLPRMRALQCGGWNCQCGLYEVQ